VSLAGALARMALPALRRLDAERSHTLGLAALEALRPWARSALPAGLACRCFGIQFAHPLGLAAGFDKNGDHLDALGALGFSHIELGTVTPRPQPGNPRPRLFRVPERQALVNRMGFNNLGVEHLVSRLAGSRYRGVRGVSIGKNADTPLEHAVEDYLTCLTRVYPHADYVAVNVSSPNTARLRELQAPASLERIAGALLEARARLQAQHARRVPLLVKIAPDLGEEQLRSLAATVRGLGIDGLIATNTTSDHSGIAGSKVAAEVGGLSGAPLRARALEVVARLAAELGPRFPLIGVGGIVAGADAAAMLAAGAHLVQVWTGFAYRGPALIEEILGALDAGRRRGGARAVDGEAEVT
jgi:dihydroorotate dehydrogenase